MEYFVPKEHEFHRIARINVPANIAKMLQKMKHEDRLIQVIEQLKAEDIPGYKGVLQIEEKQKSFEYVISFIAEELYIRNKTAHEAMDYCCKLLDDYDPSKEFVVLAKFENGKNTINKYPLNVS